MKLNPKQYLAITHLITGKSIDQAARKSGIGGRTLTRWLTLSEFREELERRLNLQVEEAFGYMRKVVKRAAERLASLMDSANDFVALRACQQVLENVIRISEITALEERVKKLEELAAVNGKD